MSREYIVHRAAKRQRASRLELRLLDRDLAEAGVHIPWTTFISADDATRCLVLRVIQDVLRAA